MKRFIHISLGLTLGVVLTCLTSYLLVESAGWKTTYTDVNEIKAYDVALVLGTSKFTRTGRHNPYFSYRIDAAAKLYFSGKVKKILVSGDNSLKEYNEPQDMYQALIAKGIPKDDIVLDYAGFRTFDSVIRAREVFGQDSFIIVSQQFHIERAIYIAHSKDMKVVGFAAKDPTTARTKMFSREILARTKAVLDCYVLGTDPKFLGEKVDMGI